MKFNDNISIKHALLKIALGLILLSPVSCQKFVEIPPPITKLSGNTVFTSDATATASILGIYHRMIETYSNSASFVVTLYSGLSADEFTDYSTSSYQRQFSENGLNANNSNVYALWQELYQYIYTTNAILEGLENAQGVSADLKKQLEGEAKFVRGFCNFYLVNLYGDVPLILTTDYKENAIASRKPATEVYEQIITDLTDAKSLLANDYTYSDGERIRPNKWAATAMLARVYLYTKDWKNAEIQAKEVIDNVSLYGLVGDLNTVFLKNSKEAIWQLQPIVPGYNTFDGYQFILTSGPNWMNTTTLSNQLAGDFETGDKRKTNWVGTVGTAPYYFPYKYKLRTVSSTTPPNEYLMILRLAEQYLIRAEARAQLGDISGSRDDIKFIRERAGGGVYPSPGTLPNTTANDKASLLVAIENERRAELFAEWGHRWMDLKRTGRATAVLTPLKTGWQSTDVLFPIPQNEILRNPNLTQNPGY